MAEAMKRTGTRVRDLAPRDRALALVLIIALGAAPFAAAVSGLAKGWQPTGDVAVISLRTLDVWKGHPPLLGQTSTAEELTGTPANHPGPIENWVLAGTTKAAGDRAGIVVGTALINSAALVGVAWLCVRRGGVALLALMSVAVAGLVWSLGAASLYDPFNSELATYPMLVAIVAAWCVLVGDLRVTPILAAAVTVVGQLHIVGPGFCAPLVLIALAAIGLAWRRHPGTVRRDRAYLFGALGVLAVGWSPVLAYELGPEPSNVAALWKAATTPRPRIGLSFTLERLATAVAPVPTFLRRTGRFGFISDVSPVQVFLAFLIIAGGVALSPLVKRRDGRNHPGRLAWLLVAVAVTSTISGSGQPPLSAFRADGTRWLWVVSLGFWVALAWEGWNLVSDARRDALRRPLAIGGGAVAVLVLLGALGTARLADQRDGDLMSVTDRTASAVIDDLPEGTYHVRFEGNQALVAVGPGVVYRLEASGSDVVLDRNVFTRGYTDRRTDGRTTDAQLRITSDAGAKANDGEQLLSSEAVDPGDPDAGTIKVFVTR
ncbi:MAG TPA: hypothetical protein VNQ33_04425 [Acidimicrobiales bacterium]|nr:hypothetical protein [Acidimicrobiales bacterium]